MRRLFRKLCAAESLLKQELKTLENLKIAQLDNLSALDGHLVVFGCRRFYAGKSSAINSRYIYFIVEEKSMSKFTLFAAKGGAFTLLVLFFFVNHINAASQINIADPAGSGQFGVGVAVLPNGNIVVNRPDF